MMLRTAMAVGVALLSGCSTLSMTPPPEPIDGTPVGDPSIERVVFLIGDAGENPDDGGPVLRSLAAEVEGWSGALAADSAVSVVFLGDNVYPNGVNSPGNDDRARDSLRLANQMAVVGGPAAQQNRSFGVFLLGNHDWGGRSDEEGEQLVLNQEELITGAAAQGLNIDLMPPALDPGPEVLDLGPHMKLVTVDTQWWLTNEGTLRRRQALQDLRVAVREPADRFVLFAAHHPPVTGGPHGGHISIFEGLGARRLIYLTGANGQDVSALPYQNMIEDFESAFAGTDATVLYAGGHSHTLQILQGATPGAADWTLISGAGSKNSPVTELDETEFLSSASGYMRLLIGTDGGLLVEVVAEGEDGSFDTVWAHRIR